MQSNVCTLTAPLSTAVVQGQVAWGHIKSRDKKLREDWLRVGEALLELRRMAMKELRLEEPKGGLYAHRFSHLCEEHGFGDLTKEYRSAAAWMAENWTRVRDTISPSLTHPLTIRQAYRERERDAGENPAGEFQGTPHGANAIGRPEANTVPGHEKENPERAIERGLRDLHALLCDKYDELGKLEFLELVMSYIADPFFIAD